MGINLITKFISAKIKKTNPKTIIILSLMVISLVSVFASFSTASSYDGRIGVQLADGNIKGHLGAIRYTPWISEGGGWSPWASDDDCFEPSWVKLYLEPNSISPNKDFRICVQVADKCYSSQIGLTKCTAWASSGGGWSDWAGDANGKDADSLRLKIETQDLPSGKYIKDWRVGLQMIGEGRKNDEGIIRYTPWASEGGGWSPWASESDKDELDFVRINLGAQIGDVPVVLPVVDIKANDSDGPITIPYNASAVLSWNTSNASACTASGDWSGSKGISGSESTGSLTSSKTYTITCSGSGGAKHIYDQTTTDSVTVSVQSQPTLYVTLNASPSSGTVPLNGVDLIAAVSGTAQGTINYKFDCANDGVFDYTYNSVSDNPKTVIDACAYASVGTYTAKVYVERDVAPPAQATTQIVVSQTPTQSPTVDLKANSQDGSISIAYNASAVLSWNTSNASACTASGDWSGSKGISGSESTGSLTSSKTYTITCSGSGGTATDTATINIQSSSLSVSLYASPSSGCAPLSGVDLTANVSNSVSGDITYYFDCANDGSWERIITTNSASYTAYDLCSYGSARGYNAKTRVERLGLSAENTAYINANSCYPHPSYPYPSADLRVNGSGGSAALSPNTSAVLSWNTSNTTSCYGSGDWSGSKGTSGSESTGNLTSSKTYTLTCTGPGGTTSDTVSVVISGSSPSGIIVSKLVRNLSDNTPWTESVRAEPSELISFQIEVKAIAANAILYNVIVKDTLPANIIYSGNLKVDNAVVSGDIISTGLNIGNLSANQTKIITFDAVVASAGLFNYGQTKLINAALAYTTSASNSDTAEVVVDRSSVAGATTIPTGLTNNLFLDSFFLPLAMTLLIIWLFKSRIIKFEEWMDFGKKQYQTYRSNKLLQMKINRIKIREGLKK